MAENYTVNYTINVQSEAAVQALAAFTTGVQTLSKTTTELAAFQSTLLSVSKALETLKTKKVSLAIDTAKASEGLSNVIAKIQEINRLSKENRTIVARARTTGEKLYKQQQKAIAAIQGQSPKLDQAAVIKESAEAWKGLSNTITAAYGTIEKAIPKTPRVIDFNTTSATEKLSALITQLKEVNALVSSNRSIIINTSNGTNNKQTQNSGTSTNNVVASGSKNQNSKGSGGTQTTSGGGSGNSNKTEEEETKTKTKEKNQSNKNKQKNTTPTVTNTQVKPAKSNIGYKIFGPTPMPSNGGMAVEVVKGMGIAYGLGGLGEALNLIVQQSADFDNIMKTVENILKSHDELGNFADRFQSMSKTVRNVGMETKFTVTQVADAAKFLAMAGLDVEAIQQAIRPIADIALIGDTDLGDTADLVTNIMTAYNIAPNKMRNAADVMTNTFTMSNTTLTEIAESYKYAASLLSAADVPFEEATAAIGILGDAGIKGSQAGTTLRTILANIVNPTKKQAKAWEEIGISPKDKNGNRKPLLEIFQELNNKNLNVEDYYKIFHKTAASGAVALTDHVNKWEQIYLENFTSAGLSLDLANAKKNTLQGLWAQTTSTFVDRGVTAFQGIQGTLRAWMNQAINWMKTDEFSARMERASHTLMEFAKALIDTVQWADRFYNQLSFFIKPWVKFQLLIWPVIRAIQAFKSVWLGLVGLKTVSETLRGMWLNLRGIADATGKATEVGKAAQQAATTSTSTSTQATNTSASNGTINSNTQIITPASTSSKPNTASAKQFANRKWSWLNSNPVINPVEWDEIYQQRATTPLQKWVKFKAMQKDWAENVEFHSEWAKKYQNSYNSYRNQFLEQLSGYTTKIKDEKVKIAEIESRFRNGGYGPNVDRYNRDLSKHQARLLELRQQKRDLFFKPDNNKTFWATKSSRFDMFWNQKQAAAYQRALDRLQRYRENPPQHNSVSSSTNTAAQPISILGKPSHPLLSRIPVLGSFFQLSQHKSNRTALQERIIPELEEERANAKTQARSIITPIQKELREIAANRAVSENAIIKSQGAINTANELIKQGSPAATLMATINEEKAKIEAANSNIKELDARTAQLKAQKQEAFDAADPSRRALRQAKAQLEAEEAAIQAKSQLPQYLRESAKSTFGNMGRMGLGMAGSYMAINHLTRNDPNAADYAASAGFGLAGLAAMTASGPVGLWLAVGSAMAGVAANVASAWINFNKFSDAMDTWAERNKILDGVLLNSSSRTERSLEYVWRKNYDINDLIERRIELAKELYGLEAPDVTTTKDVGTEIYKQLYDQFQEADSWSVPTTLIAGKAANIFNSNAQQYGLQIGKLDHQWYFKGKNGIKYWYANPNGWSDDSDVVMADVAAATEMMQGPYAQKIIEENQQRVAQFLYSKSTAKDVEDWKETFRKRYDPALQGRYNPKTGKGLIRPYDWTSELIANAANWKGEDIARTYVGAEVLWQRLDKARNAVDVIIDFKRKLEDNSYTEKDVVEALKWGDSNGLGTLLNTYNPSNIATWYGEQGLQNGQWVAHNGYTPEYMAQTAAANMQKLLEAINQLHLAFEPATQGLQSYAVALLALANSYSSPGIALPAKFENNETKITSDGTDWSYSEKYKMWMPANGPLKPINNVDMAKRVQGAVNGNKNAGNLSGFSGDNKATSTDNKGRGGKGGGGARASDYKNHYNSGNAAPKQVIVRIGNLMNVDKIDLSDPNKAAVIANLKSELAQALVDVVHDFDETWHG